MGTTAQKIQYLDGTKTLLKDTINLTGAGITNDTFRSYANKLKLGLINALNDNGDTIYSNLEKVSGKGSNLSLTPTYEAPMRNREIYGNTLQNGTPTPSSPVPIQNVTGLQNVEVCDKNLLDTSSFYKGYVNSSGVVTSDSVQALFDYVEVVPGGTYTISSQGTVASLNIVQYDANKNFISRTIQSDNPRTFTLGNTTYYIRIWTKVNDSTPMTQEIVNGLKLQFEKGSATTYEPYNGNTYEVNLSDIELNKIGNYQDSIKKSTGKNLFNLNTSGDNKGIDYSFNGSALSLNGTTTGEGNIYNNNTNTILLKSGTYAIKTYTNGSFTRNNKDVAIYIRKKSDSSALITLYSTASYIVDSTFTLTEDTEVYVQMYTNGSGFTFNNFNIYIMLNEGSTALPYEPYGKVWYTTENIGERTLNGSETWETQWNGDNIHGWRTTIPNLKQTTEGSQSSYVISDYYETRTQDENFSTGSYGISNRANQSQIIIKNNDILNQNDFKTWLGTHNVKVIYQLETPIYEVITNTELIEQLESLNNAKSKDGTTNINVTSEDLSMILNVGVLKGE